MATVTASHSEEKIFWYSFGYDFDYTKLQNAPLVLKLKSTFIYNIHHS